MPYKDISNEDDEDDYKIFMETFTLTWILLNTNSMESENLKDIQNLEDHQFGSDLKITKSF